MESKNYGIEIEVKKENRSIWEKVSEAYGDKALSVLEIGVYRAGQISSAHKWCNVKAYTGIDPYLGTSADPYRGAYWRDEVDSFYVYKESKRKFEKLGGNLYKTTSEIFYRSLNEDERFDVVFVDGDHRYVPALQDMFFYFKKLVPGGCMIVDDYANTDTPQVTNAVNCFLEMNEEEIERVDELELVFKNARKHIPIYDKQIFIYKKDGRYQKSEKETYLWGTGQVAEKCIEAWKGKVKIKGVLDNYFKGSEWRGLLYYKVEEIIKEGSLLVIATDRYYREIAEQLVEMGYKENVDFMKRDIFEALYVSGWDV